jgi:ferredoxin
MFRLTVLPSAQTFEVNSDQTVLSAALAAGVALARSCRNGTCRACRCKLVHGKAEHTIEWPGLSREEKAEGWVLPCVLRALSDCTLDTSAI